MSLFQSARDELKTLGLVLQQAPGQYRVNFANGTQASEYVTDDLQDALNHGRGMAVEPAPAPLPPLGPIGSAAARKRRGFMYRHNRKIAARRNRKATD